MHSRVIEMKAKNKTRGYLMKKENTTHRPTSYSSLTSNAWEWSLFFGFFSPITVLFPSLVKIKSLSYNDQCPLLIANLMYATHFAAVPHPLPTPSYAWQQLGTSKIFDPNLIKFLHPFYLYQLLLYESSSHSWGK